jgi:predicted HicB family RNase H-like nuclease
MARRLVVRVDDTEKAAYHEAAEAAGLDLSTWIRQTLNAAAKRTLGKKSP